MSTRATVYIHGNDGELDIKLYHHWDGYVKNLGQMLEKALEKRRKNLNKAMKNCSFGTDRTLIQEICNIGGFEMAYPIHGDVEYIYHVYTGIKDRKANYKLRCQAGMEYGEENILKRPMTLLSMQQNGEKKKLDRKKAEKELGCAEKYIAGYLD